MTEAERARMILDAKDHWRDRAVGAEEALRELVAAGEPFIGDAFPGEQMTGEGLRLYNRWLAAMIDARRVAFDETRDA